MTGAAVYVLRLVCAACICSLVNSVGGGGRGVRRLLAGVFLALTALAPGGDLNLPELDLDSVMHEAEQIAQEGADQSRQEKNEVITTACEAYIWNKAAELGAEVQVRVELDDDGLPRAVTVTGMLSEQQRTALSGMIASELGLGKEAQTWNNSHQSSGSAP